MEKDTNQSNNSRRSQESGSDQFFNSDAVFNSIDQNIQNGNLNVIPELGSQLNGSGAPIKPIEKNEAPEKKETKDKSEIEMSELKEQNKALVEQISNLASVIQDGQTAQLQQQQQANQPKNLPEALGLAEGFVFDPDELTDPKSDSSKYLAGLIQIGVSKSQSETLSTVSRDNVERDFRASHGYKDEQAWNNFKAWAKAKELSLDDLNSIYTKPLREKQIAKNAVTNFVKQTRNVNGLPNTLANAGSEVSNDDPSNDLAVVLGEKKITGFFNT